MEIIYNCLYKIDINNNLVTKEEFGEDCNIKTYIIKLLDKSIENEGDREYIFENSSTTMKTYLDSMINNTIERDNISLKIAERLLQEETTTQLRMDHLVEILKGILIISYVKMTETENKLIISKADYNEFIEENTGSLKSGLPTKKKVFKAFIANVKRIDGSISKLITYDLNTKRTTYWWKDFLELEEKRSDERNTELAYNAIKNKILNPIKKDFKRDWLCLSNITIGYFRGEGIFDLDFYRDIIIGNYTPYDDKLPINQLKEKINKLTSQYKFDCRFNKKPDIIKDKFKNILNLTPEIDLVIKHNVANIENTFVPYIDKENKRYIAIMSEDGYEYAKGCQQNIENE